ncbi:MAG TPA: hypothetical protein VF039_13335 [Longimicrobiales bacterium]
MIEARRHVLGAMTLLALMPAALAAQISISGGASFETYTFAEPANAGVESISLLTFPLQARATVFRSLSLDVSGAFAQGAVTQSDGTETSVSGPTDTEVALTYGFGRDRGSVGAFVSLPTGHSTLTPEEAVAAGIIAADLLPFRITNWGAGGGAGVLGSYGVSAGAWGFGASAAYRVAREFEPITEPSFSYQPGNELRVRVGVDRTFGRAGKLNLALGGWFYGEDAQDDNALYQSGNRYQALASYAFRAGYRSTAVVYGGMLHRENGVFIAGDFDTPSQDLILAGAGMRMPLGGVTLLPSVDARVFRREDGLNQGWLTGVGLAANVPAGPLVLTPSARYRFGSAVIAEDVESAVSGFAVALVARIGN